MPGVDDRLAVVGEAERAGVAQLGHLGQLARRASPRVIAARKPTGTRASRSARLAQRAQDRARRRRSASVFGIAMTRAEAARGGRARCPSREVLLVLLAGRAQVHVRVDEAGNRCRPLRLDDLGAVGRAQRAGRAELGDLAAADEHVVRRVDARCAGRARARRGSAGRPAARRRGRALALMRAAAPRSGIGAGGGVARRGRCRRAARRGPPSARRRRPRPARRSAPAASRSPRPTARRRG